ncbi:hypothetical protein [Paludisphaera mucosa]|uniref:Uncharacterized protein n=1 Tax=Paludisphaera mucosa TaxID=3030827 RepID=A0ABT6FGA2_9BACT|nr:hypothetical protein [Paludisphaera mucosa]MDG3006592.1 hypothetical protein [Paludisphaera mucosa]
MSDHDHEHVHDENCDHDHDDDMVEIVYMAREDVLEKLGISSEEFAEALDKAIDGLEQLAMRDDVTDEEIPAMEDLAMTIKGQEYRLGDLAEISFEGDDDEDDEEEMEDEEAEGIEEVQED